MATRNVINDANLELAKTIPRSWMLRRCDCYYEEFTNCSNLKGKFYQLYIDGKVDLTKCEHWSENFEDCKLWTRNADVDAASRIIEREDVRIKARLRGHFANDVLPRRESPPEDWSKPLPKHLQDSSRNSLLVTYVENDNVLPVEAGMKHLSHKMATALPNCTVM